MAYLKLEKLIKTYPNGFTALKGIGLEIEKGEFVVLLGPSGCGKTTTLRMIAGLEKVTGGEIVLDGQKINDLQPKDRNVSMIFQSYAVWPHMTVYENIAYPLKLRNYSKAEIRDTVARVAGICEIEANLNRYPAQLSGGQKQRVAVARAIAIQSKLFLMDEPLSNLDAKLRVSVRTFLKQIHKEYNATTLFVTHDQAEAMALADRIVVMNKGEIEQIGNVMDVYHDCDSFFVANFMGTPPANFREAEILSEEGELYAAAEGFKLKVGGPARETLQMKYAGRQVIVAIRPEDLTVAGADPFAHTRIEIVEPQGFHTILGFKVSNTFWKLLKMDDRQSVTGENVSLSADPAKVMFFDKETGKRIR